GFQLHLDNFKLERSLLEGDVVSETITLPPNMIWDRLRLGYGEDRDVEWSSINFDVLDASTLEVIPGYARLSRDDFIDRDLAKELDMSGIDPARHPTLRLRAHLTFFEHQWPVLGWWQVWWTPGGNAFMDPFDDGDLVSLSGDVDVIDGKVSTGNVQVEDRFERLDMAPWWVENGAAAISWGHMWVLGDTSETTVVRDLPPAEEMRVEVMHKTYYNPDVTKAPSIELRCEGGEVLTFGTTRDLSGLRIDYFNGITSRQVAIGAPGFQFEEYTWQHVQVEYDGTRAMFSFGEDKVQGLVNVGSPIDRVALVGGIAGRIWWDDFRASVPSRSGTGLTNAFDVPEGEGWIWLEVMSNATGNSTLTMSLEDAITGEIIPGFEDMDGFLFDLSGIDTTEHPRARLRFEMIGVHHDVPIVDYYRLYWTAMEDTLSQIKPFDIITLTEDRNESDVVDLRDHFTSTFTPPEMLTYELVDISDPDHVLPTLDGWMVSIGLLEKDWNGNTTFKVRVSNGRMDLTSEPILVVVEPYNDRPVIDLPEYIEVVEGEEYVFDVSPYITDVDDSPEDLSLTVYDEENLTVDGLIIVMLFPEGDMWVTVRIRVSDGDRSNNADIEVWIEEVPDTPGIDDPPTIASLSSQEFDEDTEFILDLAPYVQDPDTADEDLIVTVDEPNCTVDGLVLTFYFEDVPETLDLEVTVQVSDGNATVSRMVRIRVRDVPDIPPPPPDVWPSELREVPIQSFRVDTERIIDLSPYISDRDTLVEDLTISSSQAQVIEIQGLKMTIVFNEVPDEDFTIDFTVSDGVHDVDGSFGVLVKEADEDPQDPWYNTNAGLLLVILIIVVLVVASAYVLLRRE
ncbi:MAG: hypothetical protein LN414_00035, partial [Candidatus Thermoplasmatota archaeon]|nr:hypothetical protein [Candidatus Thermoplasmatota archaeon]